MNKKTTFYSIAAIIAVAALTYAVPIFGALMHGATNIFVKGYSPARTYVFLGWIAILFIFASIRSSSRMPKASARSVLGSMAIVFALGAFMQIWFAWAYRVDPSSLALAVNGREMTITALSHNHLGKSVVGSALAPFAPYFERLDPGIGIAPFVPVFLRALFGISFLAFIASSLFYFLNRLKAVRHGKVAFAIVFGLISGQLFVQAIDGGIFSTNAILGFGLMCALLFSTGTQHGKRFWRASLGALGAQLGWYALFPDVMAPTVASIFPFYISAIALWGIVSLLASGAFGIGTAKKMISLSALACALAILVPLYVRENKMASIVTQTAYVATYKTHDDPSYKLLGSINQLSIYLYDGPAKKIGDLVADQGALGEFDPVSVPGKTCSTDSRARVETFRLLSKSPVKDLSRPEIGVSMAVQSIKSPVDGMFAYDMAIVSPNCMPRHLSVLQEMLISAGGGESIVSNAI